MKLYRFSDMVGNQTTLSMIRKALERDRFPNATYMKGSSGTGKTTSAEIIGLYLTCEHPVNGEPCLTCSECKRNIEALNTTGKSRNLIKINMAKLKNLKEVNELSDNVFTLTASNNKRVYIFEELHSLDSNLQITFLEYLDRLDDSTFIIICSTDEDKIITPLKQRLTSFVFKRLQEKDSIYLIDKETKRLGTADLSKEVKQLLVRYSQGIPRKIVKMVKFIVDTNPSLDELARYIEYIPYGIYIDLYSSVMTSSREGALMIKSLLSEYDIYTFTNGFRDFLVDLMFLMYGNIKEPFTKAELAKCSEIFNKKSVMILNKAFNSDTRRMTVDTLSFLLFESALRIKGETMKDVLVKNNSEANIQSNEAINTSAKIEVATRSHELNDTSKGIKSISADSFKKLGISDKFGGSNNEG